MTSSKRPADASIDLAAKKPKKDSVEKSVIDIDPYGDLYIHIGADGSTKTTSVVRVNSILLIAVSPVFRVMLGPNVSRIPSRCSLLTFSASSGKDALLTALPIHFSSQKMKLTQQSICFGSCITGRRIW